MATLGLVIELLEAVRRSNRNLLSADVSKRCNCVAEQLDTARVRYADELRNLIEITLREAWEVQNYPDIAYHLSEVLYDRLMDDADFVKITGFRLNKDSCELLVSRPDLSPLGDYSDWKMMQAAAGGGEMTQEAIDELTEEGFDVKVRSPKQRAGGWRNYYTKYLKQSRIDSWVYPHIMSQRLSWGQTENLAPYWYWYDKKISTDLAYPRQEPQDLTGIVRRFSQRFVSEINSTCRLYGSGPTYPPTRPRQRPRPRPTEPDEPEAEIYLQELERSVERMIQRYEESDFSQPEVEVAIKWGGRYEGRILSDQEILDLVKRGLLVVSAEFEFHGNIKVQFQRPGSRKFTGIYRILAAKS